MTISPLVPLLPLRAAGRMISDLVFPPACISCNAPLAHGGELTCSRCRVAMREVDEWDERYRAALGDLASGGAIAGFVAAWYFEEGGPVQSLVHALKYDGMTGVGTVLGKALGERIRGAGYAGADLVVPLPLHPVRMRERGFNQAGCIARGVSAVTGVPPGLGLVRRARPTRSQTALRDVERRANTRGAFGPGRRAARAAGASILLVDDVVTTGATMCACAAALRAAGARSVIACAAALAR